MRHSLRPALNLASVWLIPIMGLLFSGCGILYTNIHVPRAYRSATPADVKSAADDPVVSGSSCNTSILFLFAWGNAGYAAAAEKALEGHPGSVLYDVKADMRVQSVLGPLYSRTCTTLTGKAAKP